MGTHHFNSRPHGGRLPSPRKENFTNEISTHALTEGDQFTTALRLSFFISTHALTEGDILPACILIQNCIFQLTPSRRATLCCSIGIYGATFQLTPSRRATDYIAELFAEFHISTHALTEGDVDLLHVFLNFSHFNSRPHGGRHSGRCAHIYSGVISTHALTEGDGKFRQIFLLNRGYAYSISLYFLPHFISLLPQILSFQQKSFKFQVRIFLLFSVHLAFALQNQCVHHVKSRFCTNMFYFVFVLFTQIVKPQTIGLFIYDFF